ncbi:Sideroflexin-4 [Ophiophagus hannah]|uniref:Sideroflexin-4 n=1 Tax=Ophiophagus hannah TaxID=8665 RepID=V8P974_OPHHA|nr:Sideroflexin-4 [Ophiophagus hannah]
MDLNLQFWRNEGQTFYQRWKHWVEILDPLVIFTREADINASRDLLLNSGENVMSSQDKKSCVNSSTGDTIPFFFRGGGVLCACNVFTVRNFERESGIKVMRNTGEVIGMSQVAGKKAVRETALSRGILFGVPMVISETSVYLINRRRLFPQKSMFLRTFLVYFFCWLILPVSLSWTPQLREIKRNELEPDLVSSTKETTFFFYRGV